MGRRAEVSHYDIINGFVNGPGWSQTNYDTDTKKEPPLYR
jgi:hypothetical protein